MPGSRELWCVIPIDKELMQRDALGAYYFFDYKERDNFMAEMRRQRPNIVLDFFIVDVYYDRASAVNSFNERYARIMKLIAETEEAENG